MNPTNFYRHRKKCVFYRDLQMNKTEVMSILKRHKRDEKTDCEKITFVELMGFLTDMYKRTKLLYTKVNEENSKNPVERIRELNVSESTLQNYLMEWGMFQKWLRRHDRSYSVESANSYITSLNKKPSTIRKKHTVLQLLLQHIIDKNVSLNKFRMRISFAPKKALSEKEVMEYLEEQKAISTEDYLIQLLLCTYGLRINTAARLRVRDLEFLYVNNEQEKLIHLPDSKVKNRRVEPISPELEGLLRKYIRGDPDPHSYVFYREGSNKSPKSRAQDLCMRINKRIRNSKVLKKIDNYQYSSHMFRKTLAYNAYHREEKLLRERVRASIGQSQGSSAIVHYI
jgi:integrase